MSATAKLSAGVLCVPEIFVAKAIGLGWFPERVLRELIQLIASYYCRAGEFSYDVFNLIRG